MDQNSLTALITILVVVVLLGLAVGIFLWRRRAKAARFAAMSPAEKELQAATLEYDSAVKTAEKGVKVAEKTRATRMAAAQRAVEAASKLGTRPIGSYRGSDGSV